MLYLVDFTVTVERGNAVERQGGPGPFLHHVLQRFRPEGCYLTPTRRQGWLIVNLEGPSAIAELMITLTQFCGSEPTFTPVVPAAEAAQLIGPAIENALKAPLG